MPLHSWLEREALVRDHGLQALHGRHPGRTAAGHTLCGGAAGGDPIDPFSGTRITGWLRVEKEWEVPLTSRR